MGLPHEGRPGIGDLQHEPSPVIGSGSFAPPSRTPLRILAGIQGLVRNPPAGAYRRYSPLYWSWN